ncbi:hypothetical protein D9M70_475430 [compost metagenome]
MILDQVAERGNEKDHRDDRSSGRYVAAEAVREDPEIESHGRHGCKRSQRHQEFDRQPDPPARDRLGRTHDALDEQGVERPHRKRRQVCKPHQDGIKAGNRRTADGKHGDLVEFRLNVEQHLGTGDGDGIGPAPEIEPGLPAQPDARVEPQKRHDEAKRIRSQVEIGPGLKRLPG